MNKSYPGSASGSLRPAVALPVLDGRFRLWVGLASLLADGCLLSCCWHPTSFGTGASKAYASSWIFFDWAAGTDFFESFVGPIHLNECAAGAPGGLSCAEPYSEPEQRPEKDSSTKRLAGRQSGISGRGEAPVFIPGSSQRRGGAFWPEATEDRDPR